VVTASFPKGVNRTTGEDINPQFIVTGHRLLWKKGRSSMPHKQKRARIFGARGKLLALLLAISLLSGVAPTQVSFAQAPVVDFNAAVQLEGAESADAVDVCDNLRSVALDQTLHQSLVSRSQGPQWIQFRVQKDARYRLEIGNAKGLQLMLYEHCQSKDPAIQIKKSSIEFTALREGDFYLLVQQRSGSSASASYSVTLKAAAPHRARFIRATEVPQAVVRRATEFLEELRGSDLTPEWHDARVNPDARILYRPDIQEPAYYEFTVEKPDGSGKYAPAGFIQLGAGEHDYPVTHWDITGMSPTQELQELAPLGQVRLTEFYKIDALSYAAEYESLLAVGLAISEDNVINLGQLPGRITGLENIPQEAAELVTESIDSENNQTHEGPDALPLTEQKDWESWQALKDGYKSEYGPLLDSLQKRAEESWTLENGINTHGESLVKGDVRTVYGLLGHSIQSIAVTGEGAAAQYLHKEELMDGNKLTGVRITVLSEPADPEQILKFNVTFNYTIATTETVNYAIVNGKQLGINTVHLPLVTAGASNMRSEALGEVEATATNSWGPWSYWWAHGDAGAIQYGQMSSNSAPNTSSCASGCGATSWAMLFAWVDQRAAASASPWTHHWGIYRVNGGVGSNAVAPNSQDPGVRNMTWEIRNYIGTFCIFGSGATWPSDMINAYKYVQPRATAGWRMQTKYDPTGLCWFGACDANRNLAIDAIVNRRQPVVVGTGWLEHYPLAYGYAVRSRQSCFLWSCSTEYSRWFYVNNGWYGNNNGWTSADVWFAGTYYSN
jgi:hypothetical protein